MIVSEEKPQKMRWKLTEILWRGTAENSDSIEKLNQSESLKSEIN